MTHLLADSQPNFVSNILNVIINLINRIIEIKLTKDVVDQETGTGFKVKFKRLL